MNRAGRGGRGGRGGGGGATGHHTGFEGWWNLNVLLEGAVIRDFES